MICCKWRSDLDQVVLEISEKDKRATSDSTPCSLRELFEELEDSGHVDFTVNCHDVTKPSAVGAGNLSELP